EHPGNLTEHAMQNAAKARLGTRYTCFQCGTKFYDLNREPMCPECQADQGQAPVRDLKALLGTGKSRKRARTYEDEEEEVAATDDDEDAESEEYGLLDDDDDDDDYADDSDDSDDDYAEDEED